MGNEVVKLAFNRVEGDLEVKVDIKDNVIISAFCTGTMYRGFEQLMQGRSAWDGLVITPRICGICGTAHLYAAVTALERAQNYYIAPNATRIRNVCLMTEEVQSDLRHTFLMFTPDLCNIRYKDQKYYSLIVEKFETFKGKIYKETIEHTKNVLKIVAIFGGQWPHSSYMVPGGVTIPGVSRYVMQSIPYIDECTKWYEESILGCSLDRWNSILTLNDLEKWFDEKQEHRKSAMGLFVKFGRSIGLHKLGVGEGNLLSYGSYFLPNKWQPPFDDVQHIRRSGFLTKDGLANFDQSKISEHVKYSWFQDYENGLHPYEGLTVPDYQPEGKKYSWAKSPRYDGKVAETGTIAEMVISGHPLLSDIFYKEGSNVWSRQFARICRPAISLPQIKSILNELLENKLDTNLIHAPEVEDGEGHGLVMAARGALGHWVKIKNGKIEKYQIIAPTSWNSSPRDSLGNPGHWEKTFVGTRVEDIQNPIEIEHVIRSHDACLVCTVHVLNTNKKYVYNL